MRFRLLRIRKQRSPMVSFRGIFKIYTRVLLQQNVLFSLATYCLTTTQDEPQTIVLMHV